MTKNNEKGFTIIEVVLVLAIAGLIFLMVFVALPALQRGQRDAQRRSDVARLATAITNYQSNGGSLGQTLGGVNTTTTANARKASCTSTATMTNIDSTIKQYGNDPLYGNALGCRLVRDYLNESGASENTFADPNGTKYRVMVYKYYPTENTMFNLSGSYGTFTDTNYRLMVVISGTRCDANQPNGFTTSNSSESFTVRYVLEGGGIECVDNGYDF